MILLLSSLDEPSVNYVTGILDRKGCPWFRLNGEDLPTATEMTYFPSGVQLSGSLKSPEGKRASLEDISAVWYRRRGNFCLDPKLSFGQRQLLQRESEAAVASLFLNLSDRFWINDYRNESRAQNKVWQLQAATRAGLRCPESVITNDPEQARAFYDRNGGNVLVKPIGQVGAVMDEVGRPERMIYANRVPAAMRDSLDAVKHGLTLFQRYIPKTLELRITIVGRKLFATAIESQRSSRAAEDWRRFDFHNTPHYPFKLPEDIRECLLQMMSDMGLVYGAVDMILEEDTGEYIFLEVNSAGQWTWTENMSGHPIAETLADTLIRGAAA
ncbi:MAG: hypothetical protein QNK37_22205 [Acidobacteriota bacterium]|nr:hypothetical protein [Acidobacteriota bacterium]